MEDFRRFDEGDQQSRFEAAQKEYARLKSEAKGEGAYGSMEFRRHLRSVEQQIDELIRNEMAFRARMPNLGDTKSGWRLKILRGIKYTELGMMRERVMEARQQREIARPHSQNSFSEGPQGRI